MIHYETFSFGTIKKIYSDEIESIVMDIAISEK